MSAASTLEINLTAIAHNVNALRDLLAPCTRICAVVKADAYGLGAGRIASRLALAGVDMLAVYTIEQAIEVLAAAPPLPVLVMMPVWELTRTPDVYRAALDGRLHFSLHGAEHADALARIARDFGCVLPVHLEIDSGMARGGMHPREATEALARTRDERRLRVAGVCTHFASAERDADATAAQMDAFDRWLAQAGASLPDDCLIHAANTAATFRSPRFHARMVRVGLAWAGYCDDAVLDVAMTRLEPAVTWSSRIVHIKEIDAGMRVGYGGTWTASRPSRIALAPVGYADGYPVQCGSGHTVHAPARVMVCDAAEPQHRRPAPIIGAVNMDQITIDITDLPRESAVCGVKVEIYSPRSSDPNFITTIAREIAVPPHELLARISSRVERRYVFEALPERRSADRSLVAR